MASLSRHFGAVVLFLVSLLSPAFADEAAERALWNLWLVHQRELTNGNHQAVVAACRQWEQAQPSNPLLPVGLGLAGWHLLQTGATGEAVRVFDKLGAAGAEGIAGYARSMAWRWLTRLDREEVRRALKTFYVRQVRYPASFEELQTLKPPPPFRPADRWGKPWRYRLIPLKHLPKLRDQQYELESVMMPGAPEWRTALAAPYGGGANTLRPVQMTKGGDGRAAVMFETGGKPSKRAVLAEGTDSEGVSLAYVGSTLLILSDGDYWQVLPRPGGP